MPVHAFFNALQGFACTSVKACAGSTVWGVAHLPDNRDVSMITCGDGSMSLWKYSYPDQRKVKVRVAGSPDMLGLLKHRCCPCATECV